MNLICKVGVVVRALAWEAVGASGRRDEHSTSGIKGVDGGYRHAEISSLTPSCPVSQRKEHSASH